MKTRVLIAGMSLALLGSFGTARVEAQAGATSQQATTEIKVPVEFLVTLTEYDGAKKISSLPYTVPLVVEEAPTPGASVRVGARLPVKTENSKAEDGGVQYLDLGTNLDIDARITKDGRYRVMVIVDRSSLYVPYRDKDGAVQSKDWTEGDALPSNPTPMLRQFRVRATYLLQDGQPSDVTSTSDPLSGHVLKVEVVAKALK
jgi:Flp pilus assembly secretin CpaC